MKPLYKTFFVFVLSALSFVSFGQFSRPYRIAHDSVQKCYFVSNLGDNTIVKIDSNYKSTTVLTGFTLVRDLDVISENGQSTLIVIDQNKVCVFNAQNVKKVFDFEIDNASELSDFEYDIENETFYISDVKANIVYKGSFGKAPFFTPTITKWVTNIERPKGLCLNDNNGLMIVSDDTLAGIYSANLSTAKVILELKTNIDSLNHIVQDKEGNYFFTSWGDSYLYRVDSSFKTTTKLISYNKPSGMYFNEQEDLLLIACNLCNKVEFERLHYFEPSNALSGCMGDSVYANFDNGINSIGTYASDNQFVVEVSDENGSFDMPVAFGSVSTPLTPASIHAKLPFVDYSSNSVFRIKSTHPEFYSSALAIGALVAPNPDEYLISDTVICTEQTIKLNKKNYVGKNTISNLINLNGNLDTSLYFESKTEGLFVYNIGFEEATNGCVSEKTLRVSVNPKIIKDWETEYFGCYEDSIQLQLGDTSLRYKWPSTVGLTSLTSNAPIYTGDISRTYVVEVERADGTCATTEAIKIVKGKKIQTLVDDKDYFESCKNEVLTISNPRKSNHVYTLSDSASFFWENKRLKHVYDSVPSKSASLPTSTHGV